MQRNWMAFLAILMTAGCTTEEPDTSADPVATASDGLGFRKAPPINPGELVTHRCTQQADVSYQDPIYGTTVGTITYPVIEQGKTGCGTWPLGGGSVVLFLTGSGFNLTDYDHLTDHLAGRGYLVIAVDAPESLPAQHCPTLTCPQDRAEQSVRFAEWWLSSNVLAGAYDTSRISVVGHSRGGEASLYAARYIRDSPSLNADVPAVVALAPTDLWGTTIDASDASSILVVGATYDEDVPTYEPYRLYERLGTEFGSESPTEISTLDRIERAFVTLDSANHQQFSDRCGMPFCTGSSNGLMPCAIQQSVTRGLVSAWLDWQVDGHSTYRGYFDGTIDRPLLHPLGSAAPEADLYVMYDPGRPHGARVIDNFEDGDIATSTDGATVTVTGATATVLEGTAAHPSFLHREPGRRFIRLTDIGDPLDSIEWSFSKLTRSGSASRPMSDFSTLSLRAARVWTLNGTFANEAPTLRARLRMKGGALGGNLVTLPPLYEPSTWEGSHGFCGYIQDEYFSFFRSLHVPLSSFEPVDWNQVRGLVLMVDDPALADETLYIDSVQLTGGTEYLVVGSN